MKDLRKPLRPHLLQLIAEGLENAAAPFQPGALREQLCEMAKLGFAEFSVRPLLAVDIRRTKTAEAGRRYLEREGIEASWQGVPVPVDEKRNPGRMTGEFYELVIRLKS